MKKKRLKNLNLNKKTVSNFQSAKVIGGTELDAGNTRFDHTCVNGPGACLNEDTIPDPETASICIPSFTCTLEC
ncbi:hypothetical protein GTQ40_00470 [Flavobacteriaceae bacterium R38]|nr:hypothetical protein [Flavobacteriaceae bacterium R38]